MADNPRAGGVAVPHPTAAVAQPRRRAERERIVRVCALAGAVLYLVGVSFYLVLHGGWPTPDYLIPPLLLAAIALGRGWPFLLDWAPFLLLVLSWQATAGIAHRLGRPVHVTGPIRAEEWLFGGNIPTLSLQERLFDPAHAHWYDWAATMQHAAHFVLPVAVGMLIWLRSRRTYWRYLASVLALFYLGFIGYALYPAAPPWMAGLQEEIPFVHRVAVETVLHLPTSAPIGLAYTHFNANPVAAIPSLHAGLPMLLSLILIRLYGWRALPALLYPLTMGFNLVYLGEHYAVDALAGYAVALVAYAAVWIVPDFVHVRVPHPRWPHVSALPLARLPAPYRRRMADSTLPVIAVLSIGAIAMTMRPGRAVQQADGPVVPGLQVQAGAVSGLTPVACGQGASASMTVGATLAPVAGLRSAYLFDVETLTCYTLLAGSAFPPPRAERVPTLVERGPVRLAEAPLRYQLQQGVELYAVRLGLPSAELINAGMPADHRFLVVVGMAAVPDYEAAASAVDDVAAMVLAPDFDPGQGDAALPEPPADEDLPSPVPDEELHVPAPTIETPVDWSPEDETIAPPSDFYQDWDTVD
jgi:membrane-associated phospholipid phosphatase